MHVNTVNFIKARPLSRHLFENLYSEMKSTSMHRGKMVVTSPHCAACLNRDMWTVTFLNEQLSMVKHCHSSWQTRRGLPDRRVLYMFSIFWTS